MPFLITSTITLSGLAFIVQNFDYSIIISVIKHKGEDFILLFSFLVLLLCLLLLSPWYNRTSWLGVKHELTYLLFFVCFLIIFVCFVLGCGFLLFSFLGGGGGGIGSFNYFFLVVIHRSSSLVRLWMCVWGGGGGGYQVHSLYVHMHEMRHGVESIHNHTQLQYSYNNRHVKHTVHYSTLHTVQDNLTQYICRCVYCLVCLVFSRLFCLLVCLFICCCFLVLFWHFFVCLIVCFFVLFVWFLLPPPPPPLFPNGIFFFFFLGGGGGGDFICIFNLGCMTSLLSLPFFSFFWSTALASFFVVVCSFFAGLFSFSFLFSFLSFLVSFCICFWFFSGRFCLFFVSSYLVALLKKSFFRECFVLFFQPRLHDSTFISPLLFLVYCIVYIFVLFVLVCVFCGVLVLF